MHELIELEQQGWRALATAGDAGRKFYASVLREDAVMLFPGGMRIEGRERILESLGAQPWESFEIDDPKVIQLSEDAATVVYKVAARRKGTAPYTALISSTYVRRTTWQLVAHQQTPV
ncbi:nuclear transport factor 2 family protein [Steroidobacter sp. S1-65]|uniref:Nuclear transport factor 2 family protein n=1 Tax=Steroidobacter gossypii TaxID=2805490 RepID=A0ABS1WTR6_9GAMM|nr:nuclear transport factor 2 family protein [Steroidobacter gossypii]MBM0104368.1 nuclear transport factor 2 family protein [Steroidobacter gossypii]